MIFLEEFSENWNTTKNTRIDSLIETIETFYKLLDSQFDSHFKGEVIKVFDLNSARYAISVFNQLDDIKHSITIDCKYLIKDMNKLKSSEKKIHKNLYFITYYDYINDFLSKIKVKMQYDFDNSDGNNKVFGKILLTLNDMLERHELDCIPSPKRINPNTFEEETYLAGDSLQNYRRTRLNDYNNNLKKAYEIHFKRNAEELV